MRNKFTSEVRDGFEKIAQEKGWLEPTVEDIVKSAKEEKSIGFTDDLFGRLMGLANNLRSIGKVAQAESLEDKILMYKIAKEEKHLYHAQDEELSDLLDMAHSGDVKMAPAENGLGDVETLESRHEKMLKVVNKQPTGKYASFLGRDAANLSSAGKVAKNALNDVEFLLKRADRSPPKDDNPILPPTTVEPAQTPHILPSPTSTSQPNIITTKGSELNWFVHPYDVSKAIVLKNNTYYLGDISAITNNSCEITYNPGIPDKELASLHVSNPSVLDMQKYAYYMTNKVRYGVPFIVDGLWGGQTMRLLSLIKNKIRGMDSIIILPKPRYNLFTEADVNISILKIHAERTNAAYQAAESKRNVQNPVTISPSTPVVPGVPESERNARQALFYRIRNSDAGKVLSNAEITKRVNKIFESGKPVGKAPSTVSKSTNTMPGSNGKGKGGEASSSSESGDSGGQDLTPPESPLFEGTPNNISLDMDEVAEKYPDISLRFKVDGAPGNFTLVNIINNAFFERRFSEDPVQDFHYIAQNCVSGDFSYIQKPDPETATNFLLAYFSKLKYVFSKTYSMFARELLQYAKKHPELSRKELRKQRGNNYNVVSAVSVIIGKLLAAYQNKANYYNLQQQEIGFKPHPYPRSSRVLTRR